MHFYGSDLKFLSHFSQVYIETSGGLDSEKIFEESSFAKILDAHANTIRLIIVLPFTDLDENSKEPKG